MWAVVLVPMWLRRHETGTEARSVDRFSSARRALSRRPVAAPDRRYVLVPARSQPRRSVHVTGAPAALQARLGARRQRSRAELVARRRRNLLVLLAATPLSLVLAATGVLPWALQLIIDVALVGYLLRLRSMARRARSARVPPAGRSAAGVEGTRAPRAPHRVVQRVAQRVAHRPGDRELPPVAEPMVPAGTEPAAATGTEGWEPVPVPPPTYTLKPPAPTVSTTLPVESASETTQPFAPIHDDDIHDDDVDSELDEILDRRWAVGD